MSDTDRRAPRKGWTEVHALPHDCPVLAVACGNAIWPQPSRGRHGRHYRNRHVGARLQLAAPEYLRPACGSPQAEWLFDSAVRQVSRGSRLRGNAHRPLRSVADGLRLRALLWVHRRGEQPVLPGVVRRNDAGRTRSHAEEGYHLMEDLADKTIAYMHQQKAIAPDKPFFIY